MKFLLKETIILFENKRLCDKISFSGDKMKKQYLIYADESHRKGKFFSNFYGGALVNYTEIEKIKISEEIIQEPVNKIIQVNSNTITSRSEGETRGKITGTVAEYQEYAREACKAYGWSDGEFGSLVKLWNRESGWNPNTRNRSSGAYGIPQALPASKMKSAGSDYMTNYRTQINWGLSYISSRYGSPSSAWGYFQSNGWY